MIEVQRPLPEELASRAQRGTWFSRSDAEQVLGWLDREKLPLFGIDAARPLANGKWMLLLDPMLTVPDNVEASESVASGFELLASVTEPDLMFEPVWPGY